nr:MAG TPA: hypothetical protein [Caudoviricetes sp.]
MFSFFDRIFLLYIQMFPYSKNLFTKIFNIKFVKT